MVDNRFPTGQNVKTSMCGALNHTWDVYITSPCQGSGNIKKEGTKIINKPEIGKGQSETAFWTQALDLEFVAVVVVCTILSTMDGGGARKLSPYLKSSHTVMDYQRRESRFIQECSPWWDTHVPVGMTCEQHK